MKAMAALVESVRESSKVSPLFFVVSGEHASLPAAEIQAVLESESVPFTVQYRSYRLLTLEAPKEALRAVSERSLMYESCGFLLGSCEAGLSAIFRFVRSLPLEALTKGAKTFAVRSARLGGAGRPILRTELEREVGALVKEQVPSLRVQLQNPDLTFMCLLFESSFLFGLSGYTKPSGLVAPRRPRKRPVFHPATMPPKIARCMVNLARAKPAAIFADPFCGVGGLLIEAAVIGCEPIGVDADLRMITGARRNLRHFGLRGELVLGDARYLPLHGVDAMATDPPYGRDSSTRGIHVASLIDEFLGRAKDMLKTGSHLCISAPDEVSVEAYARKAGFRMRERHLARIHRSLTRQFVILQKP